MHAKSLNQIKNEMILHSRSHNVQIELIEHFFLQYKKDCFGSNCFTDFICKYSILSHKMDVSLFVL